MFEALITLNTGKPWALFYDLAAQFASFGGTSVDTNTIAWLEGAAGVNRGDTAAADFIRGYTAAQISIRSGQQINDEQLQAASDGIAESVFLDISFDRALPSINEIGSHDVGGTIESLESFGLPNNLAIWSGNLLFPGLGDASFFRANLIDDTSDTYDLITAVASNRQVGPITSLTSALESFWTLFSNSDQISAVASETADFLAAAYGFNGVQLGGFVATANLDVGQQSNADTLVGSGGADFLHGGGGNDHFVGGIAEDVISGPRIDIIDGGTGYDSVSYVEITSQYDITGIAVLLGVNLNSSVPSSAIITYEDADTSQNYLFDIEAITLGSGNDWVEISSLTNLQLIDARGHTGGKGDGIDLSSSLTAATVDLAKHTISIDGQDMSIVNFENVIGSSFGDTIVGNDQNNIIEGGAGADTIDGGEGIDVVRFEPSGSAVQLQIFGDSGSGSGGDAAGDTYTGVEAFAGTNSGDEFTVVIAPNDSSVVISGGDGDDELVALSAGDPVVFWGGAGADKITAQRTMIVNVSNLTEENFHLFDLSMVNVGASFDWGLIDVVLLNPDSQDRFLRGGPSGPEVLSTQESTWEVVTDVFLPEAGWSSPLKVVHHLG